MESTLTSALSSLSFRIEALAKSRDEALRQRDEARAECENLKHTLIDMRRQLDKALCDVEYLKVSHKLAATPQALADSRVVVRHLIARVDKAIKLINDDPEI